MAGGTAKVLSTSQSVTVPAGTFNGCAVVEGSRLIGRVTSCRYSPHAGRPVGLAWVPAAQSADGSQIEIIVEGRTVWAEVSHAPFYDPEGARQRA